MEMSRDLFEELYEDIGPLLVKLYICLAITRFSKALCSNYIIMFTEAARPR